LKILWRRTHIWARSPPSEKDQRDEREKKYLGRRRLRDQRELGREREIDGSDFGWEINLTDMVK
jgi:hypothetical protein